MTPVQQQILTFFNNNASKPYIVNEIATSIKQPVTTTATALNELHKMGYVYSYMGNNGIFWYPTTYAEPTKNKTTKNWSPATAYKKHMDTLNAAKINIQNRDKFIDIIQQEFEPYFATFTKNHPEYSKLIAWLNRNPAHKKEFWKDVTAIFLRMDMRDKAIAYPGEKYSIPDNLVAVEHAFLESLKRLVSNTADRRKDVLTQDEYYEAYKKTSELADKIQKDFINRIINVSPKGIVIPTSSIEKFIKDDLAAIVPNKNHTDLFISMVASKLSADNIDPNKFKVFFSNTDAAVISSVLLNELKNESTVALNNFEKTCEDANKTATVYSNIFNGNSFDGLDLRSLSITTAFEMSNASFKNTNLSLSNWKNVKIKNCDFTNAKIIDAVFTPASFSKNIIEKTDFKDSSLSKKIDWNENKGNPKNIFIRDIDYDTKSLKNIKKDTLPISSHSIPLTADEIEDAKTVALAIKKLLSDKDIFAYLNLSLFKVAQLNNSVIQQLRDWLDDSKQTIPTFISLDELKNWLVDNSKNAELENAGFDKKDISILFKRARDLENGPQLSKEDKLKRLRDVKINAFVAQFQDQDQVPVKALLNLLTNKDGHLYSLLDSFNKNSLSQTDLQRLYSNLVSSIKESHHNSYVSPVRHYQAFPYTTYIHSLKEEDSEGSFGEGRGDYSWDNKHGSKMFAVVLRPDITKMSPALARDTHRAVTYGGPHINGAVAYSRIMPLKYILTSTKGRPIVKNVWFIVEMQSDAYQHAFSDIWDLFKVIYKGKEPKGNVDRLKEQISNRKNSKDFINNLAAFEAVINFRKYFSNWPENLLNAIIELAGNNNIDEIWMPQGSAVAENVGSFAGDWSYNYDRPAKLFKGNLKDVGVKVKLDPGFYDSKNTTSNVYVIPIKPEVTASLNFDAFEKSIPLNWADKLDIESILLKYKDELINILDEIGEEGLREYLSSDLGFNNPLDMSIEEAKIIDDTPIQELINIVKGFTKIASLKLDWVEGQPETPQQKKQRLLAIVKHPEYYAYNSHNGVWQMSEYEKALEELKDEFGINIYEPDMLSKEDALLIHSPTYVEKVFKIPSKKEYYNPGWADGPWDESSQKAVLRSAGGTIKTNTEALNNGIAVQMYDAFHHAYPDHGEGFCVLNDVAIAAKKLSKENKKVLIIDTDVHQGQGTAVCTQGDPNIYTLSYHQESIYPQKEKSNLDIGYEDYITGENFLKLLVRGLDQAMSEFGKPDLVMYVAGTDLYKDDRLSDTNIEIEDIRMRDEIVFKYFGEKGIPISVSIPQGYANLKDDSRTMIKNTLREANKALMYYDNPDSLKLDWAANISDQLSATDLRNLLKAQKDATWRWYIDTNVDAGFLSTEDGRFIYEPYDIEKDVEGWYESLSKKQLLLRKGKYHIQFGNDTGSLSKFEYCNTADEITNAIIKFKNIKTSTAALKLNWVDTYVVGDRVESIRNLFTDKIEIFDGDEGTVVNIPFNDDQENSPIQVKFDKSDVLVNMFAHEVRKVSTSLKLDWVSNEMDWEVFVRIFIKKFVEQQLRTNPDLGNKKSLAKDAYQFMLDEIPENVKNDPNFEIVINKIKTELEEEYGDFTAPPEAIDNLNLDTFTDNSPGGELLDPSGQPIEGENDNWYEDLNLNKVHNDEDDIKEEMINEYLDQLSQARSEGNQDKINDIKQKIQELQSLSSLKLDWETHPSDTSLILLKSLEVPAGWEARRFVNKLSEAVIIYPFKSNSSRTRRTRRISPEIQQQVVDKITSQLTGSDLKYKLKVDKGYPFAIRIYFPIERAKLDTPWKQILKELSDRGYSQYYAWGNVNIGGYSLLTYTSPTHRKTKEMRQIIEELSGQPATIQGDREGARIYVKLPKLSSLNFDVFNKLGELNGKDIQKTEEAQTNEGAENQNNESDSQNALQSPQETELEDIHYLDVYDIIEIHNDILETYGGAPGLFQGGEEKLEAALGRMRSAFGGQEFYPSLFEKAAVLMHSIITSHPFVDGNKRTAYSAAVNFLRYNDFDIDDSEELADLIIQVASNEASYSHLHEWIEKNTKHWIDTHDNALKKLTSLNLNWQIPSSDDILYFENIKQLILSAEPNKTYYLNNFPYKFFQIDKEQEFPGDDQSGVEYSWTLSRNYNILSSGSEYVFPTHGNMVKMWKKELTAKLNLISAIAWLYDENGKLSKRWIQKADNQLPSLKLDWLNIPTEKIQEITANFVIEARKLTNAYGEEDSAKENAWFAKCDKSIDNAILKSNMGTLKRNENIPSYEWDSSNLSHAVAYYSVDINGTRTEFLNFIKNIKSPYYASPRDEEELDDQLSDD